MNDPDPVAVVAPIAERPTERRRGDDRRQGDRRLKTAVLAWLSAGQNYRMSEDVLRVSGRDIQSAYSSMIEGGRQW